MTSTIQQSPILLVLAAIVSVLAGCPERVYLPKVRELLESARQGDFRKAYACTDEELRAKVPLEHFRTTLERELDVRHAKVRKLEFGGSTSSASGTVEGELETSKGRVVPVTFVIFRPDTAFNYLVVDIQVRGKSLFGLDSD